MMSTKTPICDFVRRYASGNTVRMHMPGHKGTGPLGVEHLDITEIAGADSLYEADGIIKESEAIASRIFGCETFYSTEGSSQCIRAMLYLALLHARATKKAPLIWAGRNAHKTFLSALALLDMDVEWLMPQAADSYLSCNLTAEQLEKAFQAASRHPVAVYVTSPDYLGNVQDIAALSAVCKRYGCLLLVDNAHGAYLKLLPSSRHPIDLGADACASSAHKTLPVLTGGAYLQLASTPDASLRARAKSALALFGSTSPSYLILQSLDAANAVLEGEFRTSLNQTASALGRIKDRLRAHGYRLIGDEELKLTVDAKAYGYTGIELAELLREHGIECEFCDPDFLVLMPSPLEGDKALEQTAQALLDIPRKSPICAPSPVWTLPRRMLTVRDAMLSPAQTLPCEQCLGRILATPSVACPPAVPIVVCGEAIDEQMLDAFAYYGIRECDVVAD